jgi:hypothetical protein
VVSNLIFLNKKSDFDDIGEDADTGDNSGDDDLF